MRKKMIFEMEEELHQKCKELALAEDRSLAGLARRALREYCNSK